MSLLPCKGTRLLLRLCVATSLLLCVLSAAVWIRSFRTEEWCTWTSYKFFCQAERERRFTLDVRRGLVIFEGYKFDVYKSAVEPRMGREVERPPSIIGSSQGYPEPRFGFAATRWNFRQAATGGSETPDEAYRVIFPLWLPTLFFACGPAFWLPGISRKLRVARRIRHGLCQQCGYDLRASERRCPECGQTIAAGIRHLTLTAWRSEIIFLACVSLLVSAIGTCALFLGRYEFRRHHHAWLLHERIRHFFEPNASLNRELLQPIPMDDASLQPLIVEIGKIDPAGASDELIDAIQHHRPDIAMRLLDAGANLNARWGRALSEALREDDFLLAIRLIDKGADVQKKGDWGYGPLIIYIEKTRYMNDEQRRDTLLIPIMLLDKGTDPNESDDNGTTPLHLIASDHNAAIQLATLLIDHGADVSARDNHGATPLSISTSDQLDELLRAKGARK